MRVEAEENRLGKGISAGSSHYRAFIGPPENYDLVSAMQFNLLTFLGLREDDFLLDIGCGSLRGGKLFISYLLPGRYFGVEPERFLIDEGIKKELGKDIIRIKQPTFSNDRNFTFGVFSQEFDFILAQSIFSHASQQQIKRCLGEARKVMRSTSIFAATFVRGVQDYQDDKWIYPGCVTYTLQRMMSLAEEKGLTCEPFDWPHPNGQKWLIFVRRESEGEVPSINDLQKLSFLENQLRICEDRLSRMEAHPYVRLGLKLKRLLTRITKGSIK